MLFAAIVGTSAPKVGGATCRIEHNRLGERSNCGIIVPFIEEHPALIHRGHCSHSGVTAWCDCRHWAYRCSGGLRFIVAGRIVYWIGVIEVLHPKNPSPTIRKPLRNVSEANCLRLVSALASTI